MSDQNKIYSFEEDYTGNLRCIPLSTRLKLDFAGVKVSLAQWDNLSFEQKKDLLNAECTEASPQSYRELAIKLIKESSHEVPKDLKKIDSSAWSKTSKVSPVVEEHLKEEKLPTISLEQWQSLSDLERFSLIKLCKPEESHNFQPAMKEFGLAK